MALLASLLWSATNTRACCSSSPKSISTIEILSRTPLPIWTLHLRLGRDLSLSLLALHTSRHIHVLGVRLVRFRGSTRPSIGSRTTTSRAVLTAKSHESLHRPLSCTIQLLTIVAHALTQTQTV